MTRRALRHPGLIAMFSVVLVFGLVACDTDDGPMEEAGEDLDEAAEEVGDEIEDTAEDVGDDLEDAADEVEESVEDDS